MSFIAIAWELLTMMIKIILLTWVNFSTVLKKYESNESKKLLITFETFWATASWKSSDHEISFSLSIILLSLFSFHKLKKKIAECIQLIIAFRSLISIFWSDKNKSVIKNVLFSRLYFTKLILKSIFFEWFNNKKMQQRYSNVEFSNDVRIFSLSLFIVILSFWSVEFIEINMLHFFIQ